MSSSFYDDASLVVIPSGYKTSKVYAEKPTDGSGDLAFTRTGDTATRVNSAGLIEKVRTNIILQSEAFNNASWSKSDCTITSNTTANPINGALTADTFTLSAGTTQKYAAQLLTINGNFTASVYLKAGTHQFVQFLLGSDSSPIANFDLTNGTASGTNSTASIVSAGNGWYRCSMAFTSSTADGIFILAVDSLAATRFSTTASTGTFIAFGYQLETSDVATAYIPTTTAAVSVGPVANVPRLDYLGSTCPRLLLEPQRTNLVTFSEQFNNAAWTKQEVTVTANAAISPDGYTNADNIVPTAVSGTHQIFSGALVSSSQCAMSVYAKANGYTTLQILDRASGSNGALFNLANGTVTNTGSGVGTITAVGNGWYRCSAVATTTGVRIYIPSSNGTFVGDGTSGVLLWGAQVEAGAYATSYIPTLAASVTRGADDLGTINVASLNPSNNFSIYFEITESVITTASSWMFLGSSTGSGDPFQIYGGIAILNTSSGYVYPFGFASPSNASGKVCVSYSGTTVAVFLNGVKQGQWTANANWANKTTWDLTFDQSQLIKYKQVLTFPTTLTDAQCIELTTL